MSLNNGENMGDRFRRMSSDVKRYLEKRLELIAISVGEHYANMIAEAIQRIAGVIVLFGALVFMLLALALYLGALLGSRSLGFLLVSLPLVIAGYLLFSLKPAMVHRTIAAEFEEELLKAIGRTSGSNGDGEANESPRKKEPTESEPMTNTHG